MERRTDVDSTKAAINFYQNVMGDGMAGFDVYVEVAPLKGPLFKTNVDVPSLMLTPTLEFKLRLDELATCFLLRLSARDGKGDVPTLSKVQVTIDEKECFLQLPCDKLTKDEMEKMEDAYYQPGAAIAFEMEKTLFPYVSKEFNVRTVDNGLQVPRMLDLENCSSLDSPCGRNSRIRFPNRRWANWTRARTCWAWNDLGSSGAASPRSTSSWAMCPSSMTGRSNGEARSRPTMRR